MTFVPRPIEGFDAGLPSEIVQYLQNHWIHNELCGPNANLSSSWSSISEHYNIVKVDESYTAKQYKPTGNGDKSDSTKENWRNRKFSLAV